MSEKTAPEDSRRKYLHVSEVAEHLGIGTSTTYDLINRKELKAKKFGRNVRVHKEELRRYEEESDWG